MASVVADVLLMISESFPSPARESESRPAKLPVPVMVSTEAVPAALVTTDPSTVVKCRMDSSNPFRSKVPPMAPTSYLTWSEASSRTVALAATELTKPFRLAEALRSSSVPPATVQSMVSAFATVPSKTTRPPLTESRP